jgi:hypothetical protein
MLPASVDADRARAVMHRVMPDLPGFVRQTSVGPALQFSSLERAWRVSGAAEKSCKTIALLMSLAVALLDILTVIECAVSKHRTWTGQ